MAAQLVSTPRTKYTLYFVLSKMSSISVDQLLAIQQLLSKELASRGISSASAPSVAVAEVQKRMKKDKKDKPSAPRKAGAWAGWTAHCPKAHAAEYESFKASSATKQGIAPLFCTQWRKDHEDEYAAFEAKWKEEHSAPASAAASVASADSPAANSEPATKVPQEGKTRKPQSEETKAAAALKRAATKAKKAAEAAALETAAKLAAAPAATVPSAPASPAPASPAASQSEGEDEAEEESPDLLPFKLGGKSYLRPGFLSDDGKTTWATGDLWESKKGLRGDWAGALQEDGSIDLDAEEPAIF